MIDCVNEESLTKAVKVLSNKLADKCEIVKEQILNPKVKVVGIDNFENMDNKELENDINTRNFSEFSEKCEILHSYTNKKTKLQTVILNAPANIYKYVRENKYIQNIRRIPEL